PAAPSPAGSSPWTVDGRQRRPRAPLVHVLIEASNWRAALQKLDLHYLHRRRQGDDLAGCPALGITEQGNHVSMGDTAMHHARFLSIGGGEEVGSACPAQRHPRVPCKPSGLLVVERP